jgi:beta-glucosidase
MHVSGTFAALATALAAAAIVAPGAGADGHRGGGHGNQGDSPGYMNARLPVDARVRDLLSRMTLAEKIELRAVRDDADRSRQLGSGADGADQ